MLEAQLVDPEKELLVETELAGTVYLLGVKSVNGKTGDVVLDANDVGAVTMSEVKAEIEKIQIVEGVATEDYVNEKIDELGKVYVNSEQPTDFTDKDIWVDTSDSQTPVISAGSTTVVLGGEVYDAIQEALGSVETALETITTGGGVE